MDENDIRPIPPEGWWPPDYSVALEMPDNIKSLWTIGENVFATLDDGRTVDLTSVVKGTKQ